MTKTNIPACLGFGIFYLIDSDPPKSVERRIVSALICSLIWTMGVVAIEWFFERRRLQKQSANK